MSAINTLTGNTVGLIIVVALSRFVDNLSTLVLQGDRISTKIDDLLGGGN
jgi:hypothetical protein